MKYPLATALCLALISTAHAQDSESITSDCAAGGQKAIVYTWTPISGNLNYTATLTDCKPKSGDYVYNGTITGNGTLSIKTDGFGVFMDIQENLSVTGADIGNIVCTTGLQGDYAAANGAFKGTVTKNNCSYSVDATGVDLVGLLTQIAY
jgi:hypothetical protein